MGELTEAEKTAKIRRAVEALKASGVTWRGTKVYDQNDDAIILMHDFVRYLMKASPVSVKLYLYLKVLANEKRNPGPDGMEIWPSQETMADEIEVSVRTCRTALAGLEKMRLVKAERVGLPQRGRGQNFCVLLKWPFSGTQAK